MTHAMNKSEMVLACDHTEYRLKNPVATVNGTAKTPSAKLYQPTTKNFFCFKNTPVNQKGIR